MTGCNLSFFSFPFFFFMACLVSWNGHGVRDKITDIKYLIDKFNPAVFGLQGTFLKHNNTINITNYSIFRKDSDSIRVSGGVALRTSHRFPVTLLNLQTELLAVAVRIHIKV